MEIVEKFSMADTIFNQLENDILDGKYKKGDVLTENGLSKILNASRTPIREAIRRLEQEDLVKETSKGHIVTGISKDDICDIYDIRMQIEGTATGLCALKIDDEKLKELKNILELQEFYTMKNQAEEIKVKDSEFHKLIFDNCGSSVYSSILNMLHNKVQHYRQMSVADSERAKQAVVEHREIYEALASRNVELAKALTIKHINNAKISVMKV